MEGHNIDLEASYQKNKKKGGEGGWEAKTQHKMVTTGMLAWVSKKY